MGRRLKCLVFIVAKFNQFVSGWWFQIFLILTPPWENDPIWRVYFSDWLVQPPTGYRLECISTISHIFWRCPEKWPIDFIARCSGVRYHGKRSLLCGWRNSGCKCFAQKMVSSIQRNLQQDFFLSKQMSLKPCFSPRHMSGFRFRG